MRGINKIIRLVTHALLFVTIFQQISTAIFVTQEAHAAGWKWDKYHANRWCSSRDNGKPNRENFEVCAKFFDPGDPAFQGVPDGDTVLRESRLTWDDNAKYQFCRHVGAGAVNYQEQCRPLFEANADNIATVDKEISDKMKKVPVPPIACDYRTEDVPGQLDEDGNQVQVKVPDPTGRMYPLSVKYEELVAKVKADPRFDISTYALETEGFTRDEALKCLKDAYDYSAGVYSMAYSAAILLGKMLHYPSPFTPNPDNPTDSKNPFYDFGTDGKPILTTDNVDYKGVVLDAGRSMLLVILGTVVVALAVIVIGVLTAGVGLVAIAAAAGTVLASGTVLALKVGLIVGALSLAVRVINDGIQTSGGEVFNQYDQARAQLPVPFWTMTMAGVLLDAGGKLQENETKVACMVGADKYLTDDSENLDSNSYYGIAQSYKNFKTFAGCAEPFFKGKFADDMALFRKTNPEGPERCGKGGFTLNPLELLSRMFCAITVLGQELGIYLTQSSAFLLAKTSGLPTAGLGSGNTLFSWVENTFFDGPLQDKIVDGEAGSVVRQAFNLVLNLMNGLVLLLLIVIALANILQVQLNSYSLKKMLPGLIIGVILANASIFLMRGMLELSGYVAESFTQQSQVKSGGEGGGGSVDQYGNFFTTFGSVDGNPELNFADGKGNIDNAKVFHQFVLNFFLWAGAVMLLILAFLFIIRSIIFFFLVPLAPLAFLGLYFQPLGFIWKRWWAMVVSWTFMPVVAFFWIWLGFVWFSAVSSQTGMFGTFLGYIFGISMLYLAMKTPFTLAGEAKQYVNKWNDAGKSVGAKYTPYGAYLRGKKNIEAGMKARSEAVEKGPVFKNRIARTWGGDTINRAFERNKQKAEQEKKAAEAIGKEVAGAAKRQLSEGLPVSALRSYGERLNNVDPNSKLGQFILKKRLGDRMEERGDKIADASNRVYGWAAQKAGMFKGTVRFFGESLSYGRREAALRDMDASGSMADARGTQAINSGYAGGNGDPRVKRVRYKQQIDKDAADKAAEDVEKKAKREQVQLYATELEHKVDQEIARLKADQNFINETRRAGDTDAKKKALEEAQKDAMQHLGLDPKKYQYANLANSQKTLVDAHIASAINLKALEDKHLNEYVDEKVRESAEEPYKGKLKAVNKNAQRDSGQEQKDLKDNDVPIKLESDVHGLMFKNNLTAVLDEQGIMRVAEVVNGQAVRSELKLEEMTEKMGEVAETLRRVQNADTSQGLLKDAKQLASVLPQYEQKVKQLEELIAKREAAGLFFKNDEIRSIRGAFKSGAKTAIKDEKGNTVEFEIDIAKTVGDRQKTMSKVWQK